MLIGALALPLAGCGDGQIEVGEADAVFQLRPLPDAEPDFTIGAIDIFEPGRSIEIVEVKPIGTPNLSYLGAITVWPRDEESASEADLGFPGKGVERHHQAIGTVVPAAETAFKPPGRDAPAPVWVGVGFRLASGTAGGIYGVEVTYRVDGKTKKQKSPTVFLVCKSPCQGDQFKDAAEWSRMVREQLGLGEISTRA